MGNRVGGGSAAHPGPRGERMYFDLDDSRLSQDFSRPFTEDALAHFDPDLVLAWNREAKRFQVLRRCIKTKEAWCPSLGKVTARVPALVHVCGLGDGLEGGGRRGRATGRRTSGTHSSTTSGSS